MSERVAAVVARNTALALLVGAGFLLTLPRSAPLGWAFVDAFGLALWLVAGGYVAERVLLRIPGIVTAGGRWVRVAGWFAMGMWAYLAGRVTWRLLGRDPRELPPLIWGGVFLVALELVIHGVLAARGRPGFFSRAAD